MLNTKTKPIEMPEFAAFQKLDAGVTTLNQTQQIRSEARLQQIFAHARQQTPTVALPRQKRATSKAWAFRLAAIPVAAAAIIAGSFALPQNAGVVAPAFANWTAVPTSLAQVDPAELDLLDTTCREFLYDVVIPRSFDEASITGAATLTEIRGDLGRFNYQTNIGLELWCLIETPPQENPIDQVLLAGTREFTVLPSDTAPRGGTAIATRTTNRRTYHAMTFGGPNNTSRGRVNVFYTTSVVGPLAIWDNVNGGYIDIPADTAFIIQAQQEAPTPLEFRRIGQPLREGETTESRAELYRQLIDWSDSSEVTHLRIVDGVAGSAVTDVVIHTIDGLEVTATLADGRFMAWWPASATGLDFEPEGQIVNFLTITRSDGSTARIDQTTESIITMAR